MKTCVTLGLSHFWLLRHCAFPLREIRAAHSIWKGVRMSGKIVVNP
jgi:hypothetical protein